MLINILLTAIAEQITQAALVDVTPVFAYVDGKATDSVTGYKYVVVLPSFRYEKLGVKIDGEKLIDYSPEQGAVTVKFDDLRLSAYDFNGKVGLSATASNITTTK